MNHKFFAVANFHKFQNAAEFLKLIHCDDLEMENFNFKTNKQN